MQTASWNEGSESARRALVASLIAGIAHDLNGRLGALIGVAHIAKSSSSLEPDMLRVLEEQIGRLREAVGLLRALPLSDARRDPRPIPLAELVMGAIRLYRCRSGPDLASIVPEPGTDPPIVTVVPGPLTEGLLLALAAAERGQGGQSCRVRVSWMSDSGRARVRIVRDGAAPTAEEPILGGATEAVVVRAAVDRVEAGGGQLMQPGPSVLELVLT